MSGAGPEKNYLSSERRALLTQRGEAIVAYEYLRYSPEERDAAADWLVEMQRTRTHLTQEAQDRRRLAWCLAVAAVTASAVIAALVWAS